MPTYQPRGTPEGERLRSLGMSVEVLRMLCGALLEKATGEELRDALEALVGASLIERTTGSDPFNAIAAALLGKEATEPFVLRTPTIVANSAPARRPSAGPGPAALGSTETVAVSGLVSEVISGRVRFEEKRQLLSDELLDEYGY